MSYDTARRTGCGIQRNTEYYPNIFACLNLAAFLIFLSRSSGGCSSTGGGADQCKFAKACSGLCIYFSGYGNGSWTSRHIAEQVGCHCSVAVYRLFKDRQNNTSVFIRTKNGNRPSSHQQMAVYSRCCLIQATLETYLMVIRQSCLLDNNQGKKNNWIIVSVTTENQSSSQMTHAWYIQPTQYICYSTIVTTPVTLLLR